MSINVDVSIICDRCQKTIDVPLGMSDYYDVEVGYRLSKKFGWKKMSGTEYTNKLGKSDDCDFCEHCAGRIEEDD